MKLLALLLTLTSLASAQFFNFGNMFGQQQQQQEPQNMPSDSVWYEQQYESGECSSFHSLVFSELTLFQPAATNTSALIPSVACTSLITVPAHSRTRKIKSNLAKGAWHV